jgi:hypothetical protein
MCSARKTEAEIRVSARSTNGALIARRVGWPAASTGAMMLDPSDEMLGCAPKERCRWGAVD